MAIRKKPITKVTYRINEMLSFVIVLYVMFSSLQMWLLFGTINKALDKEHIDFAWYSAIGSVVIFLCTIFFLRYVPDIPTGQIKNSEAEKDDKAY